MSQTRTSEIATTPPDDRPRRTARPRRRVWRLSVRQLGRLRRDLADGGRLRRPLADEHPRRVHVAGPRHDAVPDAAVRRRAVRAAATPDRAQRLVRARGDPRARTRRRPGPRPRFVQARGQDPAGRRHAPSGGDRGAPRRPAQPRRLDRRQRPVRGRDARVSRCPGRLGLAGQRSRLPARSGRPVRAVAGRGDRAHRDRRGATRRGRLGRQQLRRPGSGHPGRADPERLSDVRPLRRLRDGLAALRETTCSA